MDSFTVKKSIFINATPEAIFDALTGSDDIVNYFPLKKVTSEWKVGSEVLFDGELDGKKFRDYGLIEVLSRPTQFKYTYWSDNHGTERIPANHLTICYVLAPKHHGTQLDLEQSNLKSEEMYKMMCPIWDLLLSSLTNYIEHRT